MTTIPAPGADLATDEPLSNGAIREILHKYSRFMGQPGYYSDTEFACLQDVIAFAREIQRAPLAAVPASEPVYFVKSVIHPKGWHECDFADIEGHMRAGFATRTLYAAAPAPVSGMPDLAKLIEYERNARGSDGEPPYPVETFYLAADVQALLALPAPQVPASNEVSGMPDLAKQGKWVRKPCPYMKPDQTCEACRGSRTCVAALDYEFVPQAPDTTNPTGETK